MSPLLTGRSVEFEDVISARVETPRAGMRTYLFSKLCRVILSAIRFANCLPVINDFVRCMHDAGPYELEVQGLQLGAPPGKT